MIPRQIASALLGICGLFLVSCCFLQGLLNQMDSKEGALLRDAFPNTDRRRQSKERHPLRRHRDLPDTPSSFRSRYESNLDPSVIESTVQAMRVRSEPQTMEEESLSYDIRRCPEVIPSGYPVQWNVIDVLSNWNPDNTTVPPKIYQGLCTLDWKDPVQQDLAEAYRQAEVPFLIHNHPELWRTAERWSHYDYLHQLLGGDESMYRNEYSKDNHMPYWKIKGPQRAPPGWVAPTENVKLTYSDWYSKALQLEHPDKKITEAEHWYFRFNGVFENMNDFLYDELPIFSPTKKSFFMPETEAQRGINCRFGSKGIIAETHYDFSRNFIIILKGQKRYVLAHPNQCQNLELHPPGHPSARHSKVDWSNPEEWHTGRFPQAQVNEVLLQAGDALYLPTSWFHFIASLNLNYQCNARSGISYENQDAITECGF
jgi:hypothetical protein